MRGSELKSIEHVNTLKVMEVGGLVPLHSWEFPHIPVQSPVQSLEHGFDTTYKSWDTIKKTSLLGGVAHTYIPKIIPKSN